MTPNARLVVDDNFTIANHTKGKLPSLPFGLMKNIVLGKKYNLSLMFAGDAKLAKLNKIYRGKNGTTDILSFPISKNNGEIYISIRESKRQASDFGYGVGLKNLSKKIRDRETAKFVGFLFIHGMLHLKGYSHGSTMEQEEAKLVKKFRLTPSGV